MVVSVVVSVVDSGIGSVVGSGTSRRPGQCAACTSVTRVTEGICALDEVFKQISRRRPRVAALEDGAGSVATGPQQGRNRVASKKVVGDARRDGGA